MSLYGQVVVVAATNTAFLQRLFTRFCKLLIPLTIHSFGNLSNLQFLSENGRVHKFANSFCSLAFMLQEYSRQSNEYFREEDDLDMLVSDRKNMDVIVGDEIQSSLSCGFDSQTWTDYVVNLNMGFCSFLLPSEDTKLLKVQTSTTRSNLLVLSAYIELSVKWFLRVLLTVFPCIKACSNQNELPCHLRFVNKYLYFTSPPS